MAKTLQSTEEKVKPFRLVKYFTFTSLIVIFSGTIVLSILNTHWARTMQREESEKYALLLIENLNHQIFLQFAIPVVLKYGGISLREREQFERLDKVVRSTLHSFKVEMVNIYDMEETISYSFDKSLIGKKNYGGTAFKKALLGETVSKQVQAGNVIEFLLGIPKESRIITFAPYRAERPLSALSGPVLGVIEIVQDISDEYKMIFRFQIDVIITSTIVMTVLFLVLIFVVKRGEGIIQKRTQEKLRLEEALSRSKHMSSLGEMVSGISHEIRNPLGIIRSSAELLKKKVISIDPANTIPDIIVEESGRLNNIITDFLNFAKPKRPDFAKCHVEEILEKNIKYLSSQTEEQGYSIKKTHEDDLPAVMADFDMLYQAFLNLLINSIQAMPNGGNISIIISSIKKAVLVLIEDEGEGIPKDLSEKIWDPFFTTKEKGTGLGLVIVKNIIEAHQGSIELETRSNGGVRVKIKLPENQER
ncbi:MAG: two-component sensor histidine kinase [Desulfobacterales bacterium]|nr:two-component sensor histidine kinase [Desulfobacterales bacterium]